MKSIRRLLDGCMLVTSLPDGVQGIFVIFLELGFKIFKLSPYFLQHRMERLIEAPNQYDKNSSSLFYVQFMCALFQ